MSAYVKKIQFKLHESYTNPLRGEPTLADRFPRSLAAVLKSLKAINWCLTGDVSQMLPSGDQAAV